MKTLSQTYSKEAGSEDWWVRKVGLVLAVPSGVTLGNFLNPVAPHLKKIGDWILIKMSLTQRFNDLVDRNKESQDPEINQKMNRFILEI